MKFLGILLVLVIALFFNLSVRAQTVDILDKLKDIKPMISTRQDVEKLLGKGEDKFDVSSYYYYENESVRFTYSDEKCLSDWLAPKDTVIEVHINFKERRKLSELKKKVKLKKLKFDTAYDRAGERLYHDEEKGVDYYVDIFDKTWESITFYPSTQYSQSRCKN